MSIFPRILLLLLASASVCAAPDEDILGKSRGYPVGTRSNWFLEESVRVGSFSGLDTLLEHNTLKAPEKPLPLKQADTEPDISYRFQGRRYTINDYLQHQRTTGLLIIKDGEILVERYQYERTPGHRMLSNSMAKSLVSLALGFALAEGKITSLDDTVESHVPELKYFAYGEVTLRNLLRMSSGVRFDEAYARRDDLARFSRLLATRGSLPALQYFNVRDDSQGSHFHYASSNTQMLAAVVRNATGMGLSDYLAQRLWQPMGAESDATWITNKDDSEQATGLFSATLRDWGRLGMLLANDGKRDGKQILPRDFLLEATDWRKHPQAFAPKRATPWFGYGYHFWTFPGERRRFALLGIHGQAIYVDPELKLVLVHTAAARNADTSQESLAAELGALWLALVNRYGRW
jgi:CubicO group peptidase (beta-lactamase class C family)